VNPTSINSDRYTGFKNAKNPDVPVKPYLLSFSTAAKTSISQIGQWHEDIAYLAKQLPASDYIAGKDPVMEAVVGYKLEVKVGP
jgi:hypothetical protein